MRKRTSKNSYIEFHTSYIFIALGFILTGNYLNIIIFTSLIIMHELGHFTVAKILNIKVKKIIIYPFGGMTKLDTLINQKIEKELLVALSGIIFQFIYYLIICYLYKINLIREYTINLYTLYNNEMIFFNLLPIYPLDGSKILNLLLNTLLPYKIANIITIIISIITIILILTLKIYQTNYSNIIIYFILLSYIIKFYQKRKYLYNRLLLERYLYHIHFPKIKIIKNYKLMYKNKSHFILYNKKIKSENDLLNQLFKKI